MKSSPSCHRVAATRLVSSCQALGETPVDPSSSEALDLTRSVYAARLAICELDDAGVAVPSPCLRLTVPPPTRPKTFFRFTNKSQSHDTGSDLFPKEVVEHCLKTLEARPQSWTSYSNNRQNAVVICQAARIETEKESLLDLHRSIMESSFKLNEGLRLALQKAAMEASRNEKFLQTVQNLQANLVTEFGKTEGHFRSVFENLFHEVEDAIKKVMNSMTATRDHIQNQTSGIETVSRLGPFFRVSVLTLLQDIRGASHQVDLLHQFLKTVFDEAISKEHEIAQTHEKNAVAYRDLTSNLHASLESLIDTDLLKISQGITTFDSSLVRLDRHLHQLSLILYLTGMATGSFHPYP